jgi:hypothetical protein
MEAAGVGMGSLECDRKFGDPSDCGVPCLLVRRAEKPWAEPLPELRANLGADAAVIWVETQPAQGVIGNGRR